MWGGGGECGLSKGCVWGMKGVRKWEERLRDERKLGVGKKGARESVWMREGMCVGSEVSGVRKLGEIERESGVRVWDGSVGERGVEERKLVCVDERGGGCGEGGRGERDW